MTAGYIYNGRGQRVKKIVNDDTTIYFYDQRGQLIAEADSSGNITAEYIYLNGQPLAKMEGTNTYYYHNDHLATPQKMRDSSGAVVWSADYKPFGEATVTVSTITNNLRFPGQYYDQETGTHYNYYRDYNPAIGRYPAADPIGLDGGINPYLYSEDDPVNSTDPSGLKPCIWTGVVSMKLVSGKKGPAGGMALIALSSECCNNKRVQGLYTACFVGVSIVPKIISNKITVPVQVTAAKVTFEGPDTPSDADPKGWFSYLAGAVSPYSYGRLRTGSLVSGGTWGGSTWEAGIDIGIDSLIGFTIGSGRTECCKK